jgi:predicted alpha/beta superfamily hydrolase
MTQPQWQPYRGQTTTGTLRRLPAFYSPQLHNRRDLYLYLPPDYHENERRYPVLYMHDGQNLFDDPLSFSGEWHVDETMEALAHEGIEAIVVGITNIAATRFDEYSPFFDPRLGGGRGDAYLDFVINTVKPRIDADFRTDPRRASTGLLGSSMGGLISLYAFFHDTETFGFAGAMSPSVPFADRALLDDLVRVPPVPGRLYVDVGQQELGDELRDRLLLRFFSRRYVSEVRHLIALLRAKGYVLGEDLCYVEDPGGRHHETAWARRLRPALRFLLSPLAV